MTDNHKMMLAMSMPACALIFLCLVLGLALGCNASTQIEPDTARSAAALAFVIATEPTPAVVTPDDGDDSGECWNCNGTGKVGDGRTMVTCRECGGSGVLTTKVSAERTPECECDPCECDPCECGQEAEPETINWADSYRDGLREARERRKPLVVVLVGPNCGPCIRLKRNVLSDARVIEYLNENAVCVLADTSQDDGVPLAVASIPKLWVRVTGGRGVVETPKQEPAAFLDQVYRMARQANGGQR